MNGNAFITIPAEKLYWATLHPAPLSETPLLALRPAERRQRLGYFFEAVLPLPVDDIHAVYRELPDGRVLACGIDREAIAAIQHGGAVSACPDAIPDGLVCAADVDPQAINLLTAPYTPHAVAHARTRLTRVTAAAVIVIGMLTTVGFERRTAVLHEHTRTERKAQEAVYSEVFEGSRGSVGQPPAVRMLAELRQLQRSRGGASNTSQNRNTPSDAAAQLADVLSGWPADVPVRVTRLATTGSQVTLGAELNDQSDVDRLVAGLNAIPGWTLSQQNMQRGHSGNSDTFTLSLTLQRTAVSLAGAPSQ